MPRHSSSRLHQITKIILAVALALLTFLLINHHPHHQRPSSPSLSASDSHLNIRSNTLNSAIPDWLDEDFSHLSETPISQLSAKGQAVKKGQALVCMMQAPLDSISSLPSPYQETSDLIKYGYRASFTDHADSDSIAELGLSKAFADLGIPSTGWTQMTVGNSFDVRDPSDASPKILYPASHATFSSEINLDAGAIVATQSYGPEYMAAKFGLELKEGEELTPLQKVSDVLFLSWMKLVEDRRKDKGKLEGLEHMFRWNTIVPEVQAYLEMVAGEKTIDEIGEWPGVSYPISEPQGLAVLSSPNAKGVAWLLGQHKEAMGIKTIDRVNVFNCPDLSGDAQWCVYLHIVPVKD